MVVKTDEEWLKLVERFDVPIEETTTVKKLQKALQEKLRGASGAPALVPEFTARFQRGLEIRYELLPEASIRFKYVHMPSTKRYPAGYWQGMYSDVATGRRISLREVESRAPRLLFPR